MHGFKKAVASTLIFLAAVAAVGLVLMAPYFHTDIVVDTPAREEYEGEIDFLIIGASHAQCAVKPSVLDGQLGVNSYNLSADAMSLHAQYELLEKELERNPVKTLVLDVSYDTLTRDYLNEETYWRTTQIARMETIPEKLDYCEICFDADEIPSVCSDLIYFGMKSWECLLKNEKSDLNFDFETLKGYHPMQPTDVSKEGLKGETVEMDTNFLPENKKMLREIIGLCKAHGVQPILTVFPLAEAHNRQFSNLNEVYAPYKEISRETGCPLFDFNLYKEKKALFPDETAFSNLTHMSESGAQTFSLLLADVIKKYEAGEPTDQLFYASYGEAEVL